MGNGGLAPGLNPLTDLVGEGDRRIVHGADHIPGEDQYGIVHSHTVAYLLTAQGFRAADRFGRHQVRISPLKAPGQGRTVEVYHQMEVRRIPENLGIQGDDGLLVGIEEIHLDTLHPQFADALHLFPATGLVRHDGILLTRTGMVPEPDAHILLRGIAEDAFHAFSVHRLPMGIDQGILPAHFLAEIHILLLRLIAAHRATLVPPAPSGPARLDPIRIRQGASGIQALHDLRREHAVQIGAGDDYPPGCAPGKGGTGFGRIRDNGLLLLRETDPVGIPIPGIVNMGRRVAPVQTSLGDERPEAARLEQHGESPTLLVRGRRPDGNPVLAELLVTGLLATVPVVGMDPGLPCRHGEFRQLPADDVLLCILPGEDIAESSAVVKNPDCQPEAGKTLPCEGKHRLVAMVRAGELLPGFERIRLINGAFRDLPDPHPGPQQLSVPFQSQGRRRHGLLAPAKDAVSRCLVLRRRALQDETNLSVRGLDFIRNPGTATAKQAYDPTSGQAPSYLSLHRQF